MRIYNGLLPAQYILTTLPGNQVSFMHGTSMAAAEVSGLLTNLHPNGKKIADCRGTNHLIACLARNSHQGAQ